MTEKMADTDTHRTDTVIRALAGDRFTPFALARKLNAKVILESSSFQKGRERYSILLVNEAFRIYQQGSNLYYQDGAKKYRIKNGSGDILDLLLYFANQHTSLHQDLPFPAGGVGFLSYEFARYCDEIRFQRKEDPLQQPDAAFIFGHVFVIFDHYTDIIYLIGLNYKEHEVDIPSLLDETEGKLYDLNFNYLATSVKAHSVQSLEEESDRTLYKNGVDKVREEIIQGNILQGVLSRRLYVKTSLDAIDAYKNLRSANPSPYLFFINFDDFQLFGSSPEVHVKVKDETAYIRPLAGTRRRGASKTEDAALERELLADEKEKAEHLMLVDLARNDLGRICRPSTVVVDTFMDIEHYSHVMHIVSHVKGTLRDDKTGIDAIRATFPAGTVSGAPKIRAIEIIDSLEKEARGFYAGLVGYVEPGGSLDTCITIRSAMKKDNMLVLQAGAGIVLDSVPEREFEETGEKLRATAKSVGLEI